MTVEFRVGRMEDLPALMALDAATPQMAHWSEQEYRAALDGSSPVQRQVIVFQQHDTVNGFIVLKLVAGVAEIENLVVDAQWRRSGYGRNLVDNAIGWAAIVGAERIQLEVRESNHAARALYAAAGFQQVGRRKAYYSAPPEDAILLDRRVPPAAE